MKYCNTGNVFGHKIRCETCGFEKSIAPPCWNVGEEKKEMDAAESELVAWWNTRSQPNGELADSLRPNHDKHPSH